jgi:filamentous hemagglutinin
MRSNGWKGDPVDVVRMPDNRLTSIDNTRIIAARESGIDVLAKIRAFEWPLTADEIGRFTKGSQVPSSWGDAVTIRINSQSGGFGVKYPHGADPLPRVIGRPK